MKYNVLIITLTKTTRGYDGRTILSLMAKALITRLCIRVSQSPRSKWVSMIAHDSRGGAVGGGYLRGKGAAIFTLRNFY